MYRCLLVLFLCTAAAALSACSAPTVPTFPAVESPLRLVALVPAVGAVLTKGSTVDMSITVASEIAGRLTLSIQDQSRVSLLASEPSADIVARGEANLQASFVVPSMASSIQLFATFRPTDARTSPVVMNVAYATR